MVYKIFKKNNYIVVVDDRNFYYEEHCSSVLVLKRLTTDSTYDIVFVRPDNVPQAFYNVPFADIRDEFNAPYASVAAWETWYTTNTGCQGGANTAATLAAILATLQAQSEVEGVFVKDTGNSDKIVLQVRVWDQDSQTFINTLYFNPDGTPYTPVGTLDWVGTSGSSNSIITGPLGQTTTCGNAVAVTFCDALYTEFFDQGVDLYNIYDVLANSLVATVNQGSSPWVTSLDAATITALQSGLATETTLLAIKTVTDQLTFDVTGLNIRQISCATDSIAVCSDGNPVGTANPLPVDVTFPSTQNVAITSPLGVQADCANSIAVALCQAQNDALFSIKNAVNSTLLVALDAATLAALETINVVQSGTWTVAVSTLPAITGTVALDAATLAALENITVSGTVAVSSLPPITGSVSVTGEVEIKNDAGNPIPVSGTVTVNQPVAVTDNGGSLTVDATDFDIRDLVFATDKVDVTGSSVKLQDGAGTPITSTTILSDTGLDVNVINPVNPSYVTPVSNSRYKRTVGNTTVTYTAGAISLSVQNIGSDNVTVDTDTDTGETLDPGIAVTWDAPVGGLLNAFSFKGSSAGSTYIVTAVYP